MLQGYGEYKFLSDVVSDVVSDIVSDVVSDVVNDGVAIELNRMVHYKIIKVQFVHVLPCGYFGTFVDQK